jgi:hypothetical protein
VVSAVRAAPVHRGGRAPHVPRRLRQPRRERPAAPPADLRPLRLASDHRLLLRHHREPRRPGVRAHRAEPDPRGPRRLPGRRPPRALRRAAAPRRRNWRAWLCPDPRLALGAALPSRRTPDDRLRALPHCRRDPAHRRPGRPARGRRLAPGTRATRPRLSRRVPPHRARGSGSSRRTPSSSAWTSEAWTSPS